MSNGKITLYIASSVDGFIATEDGGVSWLEEFQQETADDTDSGSYEEFFADVDCLVMGSKTYEQVLEFGEWPYDQKPTYVVTQRDLPLATDAVELVDGAVNELGHDLKRRYGHVWLVGGAQLAQSFLRSNLLDNLRLSIIPGLLGNGISLFDDSGKMQNLALIETVTYDNGIVELQYNVAS